MANTWPWLCTAITMVKSFALLVKANRQNIHYHHQILTSFSELQTGVQYTKEYSMLPTKHDHEEERHEEERHDRGDVIDVWTRAFSYIKSW